MISLKSDSSKRIFHRICAFTIIVLCQLVKLIFIVALGALAGFLFSDMVAMVFGYDKILCHTIGTVVGAVGSWIKED